MQSSGQYPNCEKSKYRFKLWRIWDKTKPTVLFIMRNPHTMCIKSDDVTIKKAIKIAKEWGYGGIYVGNIYAFCAETLYDLGQGESIDVDINKMYIKEMMKKCTDVIYAYGNYDVGLKKMEEPHWLKDNMDSFGKKPYCIKTTKKNQPIIPTWETTVIPMIYDR